MITSEDTTKYARDNARGHMDSIAEMITALENGEDYDGQDVSEAIQESILDIEVRSDWHSPGEDDNKPTEYLILLTTGGPACRIIGELDQYCQPETAKMQWQDWRTPWENIRFSDDEEKALLTYACQFYYGD